MIQKDLILEDARIRLEPLDFKHAQDLFEIGNDDEVWQKSNRKNLMPTLDATLHYIGAALYSTENPAPFVPFAVIDKACGKAIGSTRYADISSEHRKLEIGWTWYGRRYWRTHVNSTCKLLLLEQAFEGARALRVAFKADSENDRSRAAIARIGATYEGTQRNFRVLHGSVRAVSYYSITNDEWPLVKERLRLAVTPRDLDLAL